MNTETVTPAAEPSISELRGMLSGPAAEPAAPAAAADTAAKTEPATEPEVQQETTKESDRGADGKFKAKAEAEAEETPLPTNVQKRIDKAVKAQREAERRAQEAEAKLAPQESRPAKETAQPAAAQATAKQPEAKDFDSYEQYVAALTEWTVDQREAKRQQIEQAARTQQANRTVLEAHAARIAEAAKADDWDEVLEAAGKLPCSREANDALIESDKGPEIIRHLVAHPDEARRIATLTPSRQIAEIGKLEARLTPPAAAAPATPAKKALPKPPANVGGSASAKAEDLNDPDIDMKTFKRLFRASLSQR